jgi:hypothetical protein
MSQRKPAAKPAAKAEVKAEKKSLLTSEALAGLEFRNIGRALDPRPRFARLEEKIKGIFKNAGKRGTQY